MFIKADRSMITPEILTTLPPSPTVIVVPQTTVIDDDVLDGYRQLKKARYRLAADTFVWFDGAEQLLADKIETADELRRAERFVSVSTKDL